MSRTLIRNISEISQIDRKKEQKNTPFLKGKELGILPSIKNAWLLLEEDRILDFGNDPNNIPGADRIIDASGKMVLPCWCDSHTHLVFARPRSKEFVDRINGLSYEEIAKRGGGILNSSKHLTTLSEEELISKTLDRIYEVVKTGTGLIEIKSGYGLSVEQELKMLRVIKKLKAISPIPIKSTFLAAHALPPEFKGDTGAFIEMMIKKALPTVADEGLADYLDIFCEKGFFSPKDVERLLEAGLKYGLRGKIHTNQFNHLGGIQAAIKYDALSVDHLEVLNEEEITILSQSTIIPTLLPSAPFFLNDDHFPPMRKMIDSGLGFALATDYNPGSSPSGNVLFLLSLACIRGRINPEEAINAASYNGACALESQDDHGSIDRGKKANFIISQAMENIAELPYYFGKNLVWKTFINGKEL